MFAQLAKPYVTEANETIYIRADRVTVTNIARCYARANLLDLGLARRTRVYFIEPENLLTITVPTGLPPKATFKGEFAGTFASYHKTSWESVAKILVENCVRPASWATNELGIPMQYPCYGFFGYSCEITDPDDLKADQDLYLQPLQDWQGPEPFGDYCHVQNPKTDPRPIGQKRPVP
jgi:hypothetical protein